MEDSGLINELTIHAKEKAQALMQKLKKLSQTLVLSESCTAGMVSSLLAEIPGASNVLWGSFVCYTQEAKVSMLDIDNNELTINGLVSEKTASLMAETALKKSGAGIAAAVTGLAGPDGDGNNPVGTVWIAVYKNDGIILTKKYNFTDSRNAVRIRACIAVMEAVLSALPEGE